MQKQVRKFIWLLVILGCHVAGGVLGQQRNVLIQGHVVDSHGQPVSNASVLLKGSNHHTSANGEGEFQLLVHESVLKANPVRLLIRSVGFKQTELELDSTHRKAWQNLHVVMENEIFTIEEIRIGPKEDPANAMIRLAIRNRKKHLNEAPPYQAQVYIKGVQRLVEMPKKLMGISMDEVAQQLALDSNRTGIVYLSESESRIISAPPSEFREEMISSRISGNNRSFSFNRASDLQLNFYQNSNNIVEGLSARPFISPISDQAFQYYHYKYQGFTEENGLRVLKIRVIPKRKGEPVYHGDLYLIAGEGRIHSLNLVVDRSSSIQLIDSLQIKQQFVAHQNGVWFPSSVEMNFGLSFLGVRIGGNIVASFTGYEILDLKDLKTVRFREKLKVESSALKVDSNYWKKIRPVPLTAEEANDYIRKDSIRVFRQSAAYLDSLDGERNRFKFTSFFLGGYRYTKRSARMSIEVDGVFNRLNYNLIEGVNLDYGIKYRKEVDPNLKRSLQVGANVRYGFANQKWHPTLHFDYPTPWNGLIKFEVGSEMRDLQARHPHPEWLGSYYILFQGQNPFKFYSQKFARAQWSGFLPGNVHLTGGISIEDRKWLTNQVEYSFLSEKHRRFTSNNPFSESDALFPDHQTLRVHAEISYDFGRDYETFPTGRKYLPSPYPKVSAGFKQGFSKLGNSDFVLLYAGVQQDKVGLSRFGRVSYSASLGRFLQSPQYYPDFAHFEGQSFLFGKMNTETFLLLDRYVFSAQDYYTEAHVEYYLGGMLLGKIPGVRKIKLEESLGVHYLHTEYLHHHAEWQAGLSWLGFQIKYARVLPVSSQNNASLPQGIAKHKIRIGIRF